MFTVKEGMVKVFIELLPDKGNPNLTDGVIDEICNLEFVEEHLYTLCGHGVVLRLDHYDKTKINDAIEQIKAIIEGVN